MSRITRKGYSTGMYPCHFSPNPNVVKKPVQVEVGRYYARRSINNTSSRARVEKTTKATPIQNVRKLAAIQLRPLGFSAIREPRAAAGRTPIGEWGRRKRPRVTRWINDRSFSFQFLWGLFPHGHDLVDLIGV